MGRKTSEVKKFKWGEYCVESKTWHKPAKVEIWLGARNEEAKRERASILMKKAMDHWYVFIIGPRDPFSKKTPCAITSAPSPIYGEIFFPELITEFLDEI